MCLSIYRKFLHILIQEKNMEWPWLQRSSNPGDMHNITWEPGDWGGVYGSLEIEFLTVWLGSTRFVHMFSSLASNEATMGLQR